MGKWTRTVNEKEYKLSEESAEKCVREFLDYYGAGLSPNLDRESEEQADAIFERLVEAYRLGQLENEPEGKDGFCVILHCRNKEDLCFRELKTKDREIMQKYNETQSEERCKALMGKLCGFGASVLEALPRQEYRIVEALFIAFLLV
jgi:hypothetical protein